MNARWQALFLLVWLSASAHAQTPGRQILRASSELVRVDAVVVDRDGRVVSDLTEADFEVRQDGRLQSVTAFTFVRPQTDMPSGTEATAATPLFAGAQQITDVPPQIFRTLAIVVDDLGLSFPSVDRVRKALHRFVDQERQPGDLVAIVRTGQSGGTLQQYTRSAERLHEIIDRISWSLFNNSLFAGGVQEKDPLERLRPKQAGPALTFPPGESPERLRELYPALGMLGALRSVVAGAGSMPGRKSVMLVSEGVSPFDSGVEMNSRLESSLRALVAAAARAGAAVHVVDPRGLEVGGFSAATNVHGYDRNEFAGAYGDMTVSRIAQESFLRQLAERTGGIAVLSSNDLVGSLRRALDDQNGYYLLGYAPAAETPINAGRFHRLVVKVTRPGVRVRARPGFYGRPLAAAAPKPSALDALFSPVSADVIALRLTPIVGRAANGRPVVRILLHIDASRLSFSSPIDGRRRARIDLTGQAVDTNGRVVDSTSWSYAISSREAAHVRAIESGFVYRNEVRIRRPGFYHIGVLVRDAGSGVTGTAGQFIEVPDFEHGEFALSGLLVSGTSDEAQSRMADSPRPSAAGPPSVGTNLAIRSFAAGERVTYAVERTTCLVQTHPRLLP